MRESINKNIDWLHAIACQYGNKKVSLDWDERSIESICLEITGMLLEIGGV